MGKSEDGVRLLCFQNRWVTVVPRWEHSFPSEPGSDAIRGLRLLLVPARSPDTLVLPSKVTELLHLLIAT